MTEATEWKYAFNDLDKYEAGEEIQYTVTEDVVKGYSTEYDGNDIINSYTPGERSRTVTKIGMMLIIKTESDQKRSEYS